MTFLLLQSDGGRDYDRFILVQSGDKKDHSPGYWLIMRRSLENRYFEGKSASVDSVSEVDVTFRVGDDDTKRIGLDELRAESLRQEGQSVR